ncbi:hypothetical protein [Aquibium microcysteis]|uniref:hypothetical protein n=1 Tax=Aquibium microcysteis TaxID=675281 RepID=UPI00165CFBF0|nr:hypothetical protein [Aquibium microcysteis]
MIYALIALVPVGIAFHEAGLAALFIIPMTLAMLVGIAAFFAMFAGVEGSAELFFWCAAIVGGGFAIVYAIEHSSDG